MLQATASAYTLKYTQAGNTIQWRTEIVPYYIDPTLSYLNADEVTRAVIEGFAVWNRVQTSRLAVEYAGTRPGLQEGFDRNGENTNVVRFEEDSFPYDESVLAVTLLTYDSSGGEMLDADIVFNAVRHRFTTNPTSNPQLHDIQNTMAHEAGHFVGLAHEPDDEHATMFPVASPGETGKRTLGVDDQTGMTSLYPGPSLTPAATPNDDGGAPAAVPTSTDIANSSVTLERVQIDLGCSSAANAPSSRSNLFVLLLGMTLSLGALRRRSTLRRAR